MSTLGGLYPYIWNGAIPLGLTEVPEHVDLIAGPTAEPVSLARAVQQVRAMNTDDAAEGGQIDLLRSVVRRQCEFFTRRAVPPQTCELVLDRFPLARYPSIDGGTGTASYGYLGWGGGIGVSGLYGAIEIPRPPLIEVVSIVYIDEAGSTQTLDPATYQVDIPKGPYARKGRVRPAPDQTWPTTQVQRLDAVRVRFRAGYVDQTVSPEVMNVPDDLIHGQLLMLSELYKTRSESVPAGSGPAVIRAQSLWQPYRLY